MQIKENAGRWVTMPNCIGGALCWCVRFVFDSFVLRDSVACVGRGLLLVGIGGKSGKRKRWRAGIFDFLFLNFFATKIWAFSISPTLNSFTLSFALSRHFFC